MVNTGISDNYRVLTSLLALCLSGVAMAQPPIAGTSALETQIARDHRINTKDCVWHRDLRAKLCVHTREARLSCYKEKSKGPWAHCLATLSTDRFVQPRHEHERILSTLSCDMKLEYKTQDSFEWTVLGQNQQAILPIGKGETAFYEFHFRFDFDAFEPVTHVKINKADCEIELSARLNGDQ